MPYLKGLFALVIAAVGWYYMFYSQAASRLALVENMRLNMRRVRLRRVGGFFILLLGVGFFAGFFTVSENEAVPFVLVWLGVCALVLIVLVLALADLYLTWRLRRSKLSANRE